jgi:hypothetical protein
MASSASLTSFRVGRAFGSGAPLDKRIAHDSLAILVRAFSPQVVLGQ